jgi:predicted transcriptional regulator
MKISEVKEALKADLLYGEKHMDQVVTAAGAADLMEDVLAAAARGCVLLTGVATDHVARTAKIVGVGAVVIVRGKSPSEAFIEMCKTYEIPLMVSKYSLFVACGRLYMNGIRGLDGSW